jgi:hypothetical protein
MVVHKRSIKYIKPMYGILYTQRFYIFYRSVMHNHRILFIFVFYSLLYFILLYCNLKCTCDNDYVVMSVYRVIHDRPLLCEPFDVDSLKMAGSNS